MPGYGTDWPADSAEFCPHPDATDIFVVGTYKLEQPETPHPQQLHAADDAEDRDSPPPETPKKPQKRRGKCLLFRVENGSAKIPQFQLLQETELAAILDMKWCHRAPSARPLLGIADSEGHITLHELHNDENRLQLVQKISCASSETLCLSLDWSNRRNPADGLGNLIVSLSDGSLSLLQPESSAGLTVTDSWHAHDYEPWIAAWDYWNTNVVYSGGDDLKMKGWDIRQGGSQPIFVNKRFDAGVTTIQSHPYIEHILAVGSYDNTVRIFDTRKPLVPLTQADVGGGAWRVKWHPSEARKNDLLVACMHDGFKVVKFNLASGEPDGDFALAASGQPWEIVRRFDEHSSLAYGVDWSFAQGEGKHETLVASASFYDHTLHLWRA
ncbi:WD-40 repeat-containing protein [Trametes polyzona]|nr:WD-40 repeat-containing protein [Trametes polyzona]